MKPPEEQTNSMQSDSISSTSNTVVPNTAQSSKMQSSFGRSTDSSPSLKALFKGGNSDESFLEEPSQGNTEITDGMQAVFAQVEAGSQSNNLNQPDMSHENLELSDSEKVLIMKASSLAASPEEIIAAMKLAAQKEKTIQSHEQDKKN